MTPRVGGWEKILMSLTRMISSSQQDLPYSFKPALCRVRFFRAPRPFFEDFFYCLCSFFWQCCPLQIKYISFAGILIEFVPNDFPIRLFQFGGFISSFYAALLRYKFEGFCRPFFNYFGFSLILKGFIVRQEINSLSMFIYWFGYSIFFFDEQLLQLLQYMQQNGMSSLRPDLTLYKKLFVNSRLHIL